MAALVSWALPQLSRLLPLDEDSLKQIITYTDTLPKDVAAEHLKNLLGDSPQAFEFISSFNTRRQKAPAEATPVSQPSRSANASPANGSASEAPRSRPRPQKKKANIHALPARQVENRGNVTGAYIKRDEEDYMSSSSRQRKQKEPPLANTLALRQKPDAVQTPVPTTSTMASKPPPSAAGSLISDALSAPSSKKGTPKGSRSSSPAKAKVTISGGTAMHGASTALSDLDSAIRSLELQTNPSLSDSDNSKRRCNCMATRHPLLTIAPNCLHCGKIICVKEGLGPCTFCNTPLLSSQELSSIIRVLKDERGVERQNAHNAAHKRAEVSAKPRAYTGRDFLSQPSSARPSPLSSNAPSDAEDEDVADSAMAKAKLHRDKLLGFQAQNAKRTTIHDEAADFDIPVSGTNMWASPAERAKQLKQQQKVLREMEWNARPEWEKRRVVASIDVVGGKIVRKMAEVEGPADRDDDHDDDQAEDGVMDGGAVAGGGEKGGAFSHNPLMGALIRPVAKADKGKRKHDDGEVKKSMWRRVQDDNDDNEQWILDGGAYGGRIEGRRLGEEEHAFG
ncbi:hypothetical protein M8818_003552 [Zalaria obscura]|uniref:Uncharacterized protein n=1 Tax=Zalaria obscura TaxID=2024903 RepID=A0ACC3SHK6_9PEZI